MNRKLSADHIATPHCWANGIFPCASTIRPVAAVMVSPRR